MRTKFKNTFYTQSMQFAGLKQRLIAFMYDYIFIAAYILLLLGIGVVVILKFGSLKKISQVFTPAFAKDAMAFLVLIFPVMLYFAYRESRPYLKSWGKFKAGIQVVNASGNPLTFWQALLRSFLKFLPWQIAHTCIFQIRAVEPGSTAYQLTLVGFGLVYALIGIYLLSAVISKQNRTPYDWVSGSYVIVMNEN